MRQVLPKAAIQRGMAKSCYLRVIVPPRTYTSLPSIRILAKEQKVSVITVQRAYESLIREHLIHSRRGKGFFVSEVAQDEKKEIAKQRLNEKLERPVLDAIAEGLTRKDIQRVIGEILNGIQ